MSNVKIFNIKMQDCQTLEMSGIGIKNQMAYEGGRG